MRLTELQVQGFRSLKDVHLAFDALTVLIGENDAGKSSVLDILALCLSNSRPDSSDFYSDEECAAVGKITAILTFTLDEDDDQAKPYAIEDALQIRYVFSADGLVTREYNTEVPVDERLRQDFQKLTASEQKSLLQELEPDVSADQISNNEKRFEEFCLMRDAAPKTAQWVAAPPKWGDFLPRFQRYSSLDFRAPENMISGTLRPVFEQTVYEQIEVDGKVQRGPLIKQLREVQDLASQRIREEVKKLEGHIKRYNKRVRSVDYDPEFDFANSLKLGSFQVDTGRGQHVLAKTGAGTRRRMLMGIVEWDREVSIGQAKLMETPPSIIRGYDEPDTNLHYEAQRLMYQSIADIVGAENSRVQAILCTHSLTMIDRAPAKSIRLFKLCDEGHTITSSLEIDNDGEVEKFLDTMAKELGITNSLIFYERCFVLIEGETEENALPVLYRKLYGCSIVEDCIRIINVRSNGAVKEFLKLLSRNRKGLTVVFVDTDTKTQRAAKLTEDVLKEAGFDDKFISERVCFVGQQEFEDTFTDEMIACCLETNWPKIDGQWGAGEIAAIRTGGKFSDKLRGLVWSQCGDTGEKWTKPIFGQRIAEMCEPGDVPKPVSDLFVLARQVAGIEDA